ncbi:MAG: ATPase, partial [Variovorax sp.]|nr:ATPase [Variovorax sp.]
GPEFEPAAIEAIFKASQGIPRRINSVCDRVLLLGYMESRKRLTLLDVNEVVREFTEESEVPTRKGLAPARPTHGGGGASHVDALDVDLESLSVDAEVVGGMLNRISRLDAQLDIDRVLRLEQAITRLEHTSSQTLSMLKELVSAVSRSRDRSDS